jgi:hypothetical protein
MAQKFRAGLKTQTRRVSPPKFNVGDVVAIAEPCRVTIDDAPGEEWLVFCRYEADGAIKSRDDKKEWLRCSTMDTVANNTLRAGRFMPGWAERSRIRITAIEEQRLGDITEADAVREGFGSRDAFLAYFGTLHKGPIDLTRPVWAISFEVVT